MIISPLMSVRAREDKIVVLVLNLILFVLLLQLISIRIYFIYNVALFYLRMGGGKKKQGCCIETTMAFGGVGKFESNQKERIYRQLKKERKRKE